jgi:ppGpp synthetase/RelA/SpoT-type nucleotidyltranferase
MNVSRIEYSAITSRAKTLKSSAEKLTRKEYDDPIGEVTDLAGVRVVYLYKSARHAIEKIIESEFDIIEKVDKVEEQEADRFGLRCASLRSSSWAQIMREPRYDDLKKLVCEIQVRTVLQDAWAIIDHHLSYKQESDVPKILRRKLNSLAGLVETAHDQFDQVRNEREDYRKRVKTDLTSDDAFLKQEASLDNLIEFLTSRFPNSPIWLNDPGNSKLPKSSLQARL